MPAAARLNRASLKRILLEDYFLRLYNGDTVNQEESGIIVAFNAKQIGEIDYFPEEDGSILGIGLFELKYS